MFRMFRSAAGVLVASSVLTGVFTAGIGAGLYLYPDVFMADHDHDDHDHHPHGDPDHEPTDELDQAHDEDADHHEHEDDHVALTEQAFQNLGLRLGEVQRGEYWKSILVPAEVVEIPGRSNLSVSAPVTGVVTQVMILPGESVQAGRPLFEIRLTDETLTDAQSKLLSALTRHDVAQRELERLAPLTNSGAVAGSKTRKLKYELEQLKAESETLVQELRGRGMPEPLIATIIDERRLATTLTVLPPSFVGQVEPNSQASTGYAVELLNVHPGTTVTRGADLCSLAYHRDLYIQGTAFEADLAALDAIAKHDWQIAAELHQNDGEGNNCVISSQLKLLRVDNHVDQDTQTVRFYVSLPNELQREQTDDEGRVFEQWRFRPGQRLHLRLPVERWEDQLTLPADSLVIEGPNAFVFVEHRHDDHTDEAQWVNERSTDHGAEPDHESEELVDHASDHDEEHEPFIELEPVPVRLLYRDDRTAVIADDGQIPANERVALNHAFKLHLALKMQAGGGGGHHHHHDH